MSRKRSGPSGRNTQPQRLLRAPPELWAQIDQAVAQSGLTWSDWARQALAGASAPADRWPAPSWASE
jgi:hypothetical protein